jgi:hypothetical protein
MRVTVLQNSILFWGFSQQETMYLNRFVSSRHQSLVCLVRPKICRFRLIVCQVQVVLELWHITLDQSLIPIIIRWSSNSSLGPWTCFSRKAFTWACAPFDKILLYRTFATMPEHWERDGNTHTSGWNYLSYATCIVTLLFLLESQRWYSYALIDVFISFHGVLHIPQK